MSKKIKALKKLGLSDQEVEDVLQADKKIDNGEKLFEFSGEQKKAEKEMRNAGNCTGYTPPKKEQNKDKLQIIAGFIESLPSGIIIEMKNPEREFLFNLNGTKYKVVLSCPRK